MQVKNLSPNEHNPRKIQDHRLKMLKKAMARFGDLSGVVFNQKTKNLVGGHQRTKIFNASTPVTILKKYSKPTKTGTVAEGFIELDNERFAYREVYWDENLEKAANIAANKQAGEWDQDLLATWMKELNAFDLDFDLDLTMFDEEELKQFEGITVKEHTRKSATGVDEDEVPEKVPAKTKLGDIYQLGMHKLMCGDSTDIPTVKELVGNKKADMLFTDPPYGVNYTGGLFNKKKREKILNDETSHIYAAVMPTIKEFVDGPCYTWFAFTQCRPTVEAIEAIEAIGEMHALIVWHKTNATYAAMNAQYKQRHEPCIYWKPKGSTLRWTGPTNECTVWEMKRDGRNEFHPTQKPVELAERAINNHSAQTVLDLFGGSGSTLIACEKTNRTCFMMELDPHYCDVIVARWEKYTGDKAKLINRPDAKLKKKPV